MSNQKIITSLFIFLGLTFSVFGKPNRVYILQRPIHTHGCHGIEVNYGVSHKMHGVSAGYAYHINEIWHMKLSGGFSNKNLLTVYNTYHYNLFNHYESIFLNVLVGCQGSYKFHHACWEHCAKRFNIGAQLGLELEKYITDYLLLILLAETPISLLDKNDVFNYRFSAGLRITF
ncbi:MAG: hypothetical protein NMK33_05875 [Candidatus Cardinium sp.]|nr:MAG: hypothetical protein NMK33_05875 [Candidatus Cardinium sp.]